MSGRPRPPISTPSARSTSRAGATRSSRAGGSPSPGSSLGAIVGVLYSLSGGTQLRGVGADRARPGRSARAASPCSRLRDEPARRSTQIVTLGDGAVEQAAAQRRACRLGAAARPRLDRARSDGDRRRRDHAQTPLISHHRAAAHRPRKTRGRRERARARSSARRPRRYVGTVDRDRTTPGLEHYEQPARDRSASGSTALNEALKEPDLAPLDQLVLDQPARQRRGSARGNLSTRRRRRSSSSRSPRTSSRRQIIQHGDGRRRRSARSRRNSVARRRADRAARSARSPRSSSTARAAPSA